MFTCMHAIKTIYDMSFKNLYLFNYIRNIKRNDVSINAYYEMYYSFQVLVTVWMKVLLDKMLSNWSYVIKKVLTSITLHNL